MWFTINTLAVSLFVGWFLRATVWYQARWLVRDGVKAGPRASIHAGYIVTNALKAGLLMAMCLTPSAWKMILHIFFPKPWPQEVDPKWFASVYASMDIAAFLSNPGMTTSTKTHHAFVIASMVLVHSRTCAPFFDEAIIAYAVASAIAFPVNAMLAVRKYVTRFTQPGSATPEQVARMNRSITATIWNYKVEMALNAAMQVGLVMRHAPAHVRAFGEILGMEGALHGLQAGMLLLCFRAWVVDDVKLLWFLNKELRPEIVNHMKGRMPVSTLIE